MQDGQKAQITTTTTKPKRPGLKSDAGPSHEHGEKAANGIPQRYFCLSFVVRLCCKNLVFRVVRVCIHLLNTSRYKHFLVCTTTRQV